MAPSSSSGRFGPEPPGTDARPALLAFWQVYERHAAEMSETVRKQAMTIPDFVPVIRSMTPATIEKEDRESLDRMRQAIVGGDFGAIVSATRQQGIGYAHGGIAFSAWLRLVSMYRTTMGSLIRSELSDIDQQRLAIDGMNIWIDFALALLGEAYLQAKETIIARQQEAIRELSTPVLQIADRLLILPVVGVVDSVRARTLTEDLLRAVRDRRARLVVMDITGVPVVDSKVANHFVQTVEAARLMGARVIVTGISPEIAQTLVTIGADLGHVQTLGDLQSGLEEALHMLGMKMAKNERKPPAENAED